MIQISRLLWVYMYGVSAISNAGASTRQYGHSGFKKILLPDAALFFRVHRTANWTLVSLCESFKVFQWDVHPESNT